jgi:hypothetical protein
MSYETTSGRMRRKKNQRNDRGTCISWKMIISVSKCLGTSSVSIGHNNETTVWNKQGLITEEREKEHTTHAKTYQLQINIRTYEKNAGTTSETGTINNF